MVDAEEIRRTANSGAPERFIRLAVECMKHEPGERPSMKRILEVLRECEMEVAGRADGGEDIHVGTIKFATGGKKRPNMPPRIPSFGRLVNSGDLQPQPQTGGGGPTIDTTPDRLLQEHDSDSDDSDDDLERVLSELEIGLAKGGEDELDQGLNKDKDIPYSTSVVRGSAHDKDATIGGRGNVSSIMTIKPDSPTSDNSSISRKIDHELDRDRDMEEPLPPGLKPDVPEPVETVSTMTIDSFRTAPESESESGNGSGTPGGSNLSVAVATIGDANSHLSSSNLDAHAHAATAATQASSMRSTPGIIQSSSSFLYHRFTMIKPGTKQRHSIQISSPPPLPHSPLSTTANRSPPRPPRANTGLRFGIGGGGGGVNGKRTLVDSLNFGPFDFILGRSRKSQTQTQISNSNSNRSPPLTTAPTPVTTPATKCDLCGKRLGLGYKTILECDDCGIRYVLYFLPSFSSFLFPPFPLPSLPSSLSSPLPSPPSSLTLPCILSPFLSNHHCESYKMLC